MATFMEAIVGWLKGSAQLLSWLLSSVVIPMTVWFTVLRHDVTDIAKEQASYRAFTDQRFAEINDELRRRTTTSDAFKDDLARQLSQISTSLGEVKGELRRISR